jgi:hypothetical protein
MQHTEQRKPAEERVICLKWQPQGTSIYAYHFYHEECYKQFPVVLPGMQKFFLPADQPFIPSLTCCTCGKDIETVTRAPGTTGAQEVGKMQKAYFTVYPSNDAHYIADGLERTAMLNARTQEGLRPSSYKRATARSSTWSRGRSRRR